MRVVNASSPAIAGVVVGSCPHVPDCRFNYPRVLHRGVNGRPRLLPALVRDDDRSIELGEAGNPIQYLKPDLLAVRLKISEKRGKIG